MRPTALLAGFVLAIGQFAGGPAQADHLAQSTLEARTIIAVAMPAEAIAALLPAGWRSVPFETGPGKGANLNATLYDQLSVVGPDGKPEERSQVLALSAPVMRPDGKVVSMVVGGFVPPAGVPGAYSVQQPAAITMTKQARSLPAGDAQVEESWDFAGTGDTRLHIALTYARGNATPAHAEVLNYSAAKPDFYRIYKIDQAVDVLRSGPAGIDRVSTLTIAASGAIAAILGQQSTVIAVISAPYYHRDIWLPD